MKVRLKSRLLVLTAETDAEAVELREWSEGSEGHVYCLNSQDAQTVRFVDLGGRAEACREPLNVTSLSSDPTVRLISNFAHSPFELDGVQYGSVEAFWQGLKFPHAKQRQAIAPLHGSEAKRAGDNAPESDTIVYQGQVIRMGTSDHWRLMTAACWAKFSQHEPSRLALLGTGDRPLTHIMRRDSRNIPGVVIADIWMRVRTGLRGAISKGVVPLTNTAAGGNDQCFAPPPSGS